MTRPADDVETETSVDLSDADVDELAERIMDGSVSERIAAARELVTLSKERPEALAPVTEPLVTATADELPEVRHHALRVLARVAEADPDACTPAIELLSDRIAIPKDRGPSARDIHDRIDDTSLAGRISDLSSKSSARSWFELELELFVLAQLVTVDPERVASALEPRLDVLSELLEADHERIRGQVTGLYAYVAEAYPDEAQSASESLIGNLDDEEPSVRASAVWALKYVGTPEAQRAIQSATDDETEVVRAAARQVLEEMERSVDE